MKTYFSRYLIFKLLIPIVSTLFLFSSSYIIAKTKDNPPKDNILPASKQKIDKKDLEGVEVKFDYSGHQMEREIAYKYYSQNSNNEGSTITKEQIGIFLYDLNEDGKEEILAYSRSRQRLDSEASVFRIFKQSVGSSKTTQTSYEPVPRAWIINENIKILKSSNLGYHDLLIDDRVIWQWDGTTYGLIRTLDGKLILSGSYNGSPDWHAPKKAICMGIPEFPSGIKVSTYADQVYGQSFDYYIFSEMKGAIGIYYFEMELQDPSDSNNIVGTVTCLDSINNWEYKKFKVRCTVSEWHK
jgi:hypothetical protein